MKRHEFISDYLEALGVKHTPDRKARVFTVQMSLENDLIIGMTDEHAMRCDSDNAVSFRELIGSQIADPYGRSTQVYLDCAAQMSEAFDAILALADKMLLEKRAQDD